MMVLSILFDLAKLNFLVISFSGNDEKRYASKKASQMASRRSSAVSIVSVLRQDLYFL